MHRGKMNSTEWENIKQVFLTAIEMPEQKRAEYLAECDEHVRAKVKKLLSADENAKSFIVESAAIDAGLIEENDRDAFVGENIDGYKIIREIGHGGMGTVYLANREGGSFDKTVALKLVKRGMDTNAVLKRFVMERSILAQLEHPNIAGLIDGGTTSDGLPYFVMEYVDGQPVTKYCDANDLSVSERLELFQKVCAAISYAHANLVVHRDVKPSNILVTHDGTPKLLDFGIAKLLHPDWSLDTAEATATMFRILTPEYASPEQIRGLPVTTASDVYSLGIVLYELLCGERPYKIESRFPEEAANKILTAEPVRPSSVVSAKFLHSKTPANFDTVRGGQQATNEEQRTYPKSQIPNLKSLKGDLDNIVLKAIRKEPERRYASVQEFSEDIHRHLAGLPVTATADTKTYRLKKFVRRHSAGVAAGCLILLTLIMATAITGWQAIIARRERDRAEQRFNQVRKLANTVLFDYHERIKEMSGATEVREKMVKDSLEYLDNLANESDFSLDLQRELALAYRKVGEIQGDVSWGGNLGESNAALESYTKALAIQKNIVAANSSNTDDRGLLARLMIDIAQRHEFTGDLQSRENYSRGAIEIFRQLAAEAPDEIKSHSDLARALWTLASTVRAKGDLDGAFASYGQAAEIYESLAVRKPEDRKFIRNAALTYKNMGGVLEQKKDFSSALDFYRKALTIDSKNAADEPNSITSQLDLSFSYGSIASALTNIGRLDAASDSYHKELEIQEKIAAADKKNEFAQSSLARTYQQFGAMLEKLERYEDAADNFQKSIRRFEQLVAADPKNARRSVDLATSYSLFGNSLSNSASKIVKGSGKLARLREAQAYRKRGIDIFEGLRSQNTLDSAAEETFVKTRENWQKTADKIARLVAK